jgi:hypothetical protein
MLLRLGLIALWGMFSVPSASLSAADTPVSITGTWAGESKCTVPSSPCHDEHVVYEIKRDAKEADHYTVDAYKIVSGKRDFMGTLHCRYPAASGGLQCIGRGPEDVWTFTVSGDQMSGTLTMGADKQLYRKVEVSRPALSQP